MLRILSLLLLSTLLANCANRTHNNQALNIKSDDPSPSNITEVETPAPEADQIATFLTFQENNAEEAINFYISLFDNSKVIEIQRHGADGPAKEGTILYAKFELNGSLFMCSDSYIKHEWDFTPGVSNFVECSSEEELQNLFTKLSDGGQVMVPLDNYGWSKKFAFVEDRFGVSWQLNLK